MRAPVTIAPYWIERSRRFGTNLVARYASEEGKRSPSRSRSGARGAEANAPRLGMSKLGEIAAAQFFGTPPERVIKWTCGGADHGADLELSFGRPVVPDSLFRFCDEHYALCIARVPR